MCNLTLHLGAGLGTFAWAVFSLQPTSGSGLPFSMRGCRFQARWCGQVEARNCRSRGAYLWHSSSPMHCQLHHTHTRAPPVLQFWGELVPGVTACCTVLLRSDYPAFVK